MSEFGALTVAIDGPAGAGKSTVAKAVAARLGYRLVDTGAIYRAVALLAQRRGVDWGDEEALAEVVDALEIDFAFHDGANRVSVGGEDVTDAIRTQEISHGAALVSARALVRTGLLELQRSLAGQGGAVLEGRDIGTVVFPEAQVKVFLTASAQRAQRRHTELLQRGQPADLAEVLTDIQRRDALDESRSHAPLRAASDAIHVDSTALSVDEVVAIVRDAVRRAMT